MAKKYNWKIAESDEFAPIYNLLYNSELRSKWGIDDVRRRVIMPLNLGQLVTFYDEMRALCGFLTVAFMDKNAASHQETVGVLPTDWRSGSEIWVVDFVAADGGGMEMLRTITRALDKKIVSCVRFFRLKHKQVREIHPNWKAA